LISANSPVYSRSHPWRQVVVGEFTGDLATIQNPFWSNRRFARNNPRPLSHTQRIIDETSRLALRSYLQIAVLAQSFEACAKRLYSK
jgi:hypothetical protein